jgi:hypothetical protein
VEALARDRLARDDPRLSAWRADPARLMLDAGLTPDPWQRDLLRSDARRVLLLASRQAGKSQATAFVVLRQALLVPGSTVLITAPAERQAKELLEAKVKPALSRLGRPVAVVAESALSLRFANGSRVMVLPGDEKTVRAYTADLIVVDEAARVPDALYYAVRPMLAVTGGKLVMLSSAFARSGAFYEAYVGGSPEWLRLKVTASMCPRISPEFLAEERRALGDRWYSMEYDCAFGDDVAAVFTTDEIRRMFTPDVTPLFPGGDDTSTLAALGGDPNVPATVLDPGVTPLFGTIAGV